MSTPKILAYIDFKIKNQAAFKEYAQRVGETLALYGGKTIAVKIGPDFILGPRDVDVQVIQEWSSKESFMAWHDSAEYAPLKALRDTQAMGNPSISIIDMI